MNKKYILASKLPAKPYKGDIRLIFYGYGGETETNKGHECILKIISETDISIAWQCWDDYGIFDISHNLQTGEWVFNSSIADPALAKSTNISALPWKLTWYEVRRCKDGQI